MYLLNENGITVALADPRGARDARPRSNFFQFHAVFWDKMYKIIGWRTKVFVSIRSKSYPDFCLVVQWKI